MSTYRMYHFNTLADAYAAGWDHGFNNDGKPFKTPVDKFKKEYNRGYRSGEIIARVARGAK